MDDFDTTLTRENLMNQINTTWNKLQTYLASLTEEQLTQPTDAAGWTVKDHIIHLAMWEEGALALLEGKSKREVMNIEPEIWAKNDDAQSINAVLQQRYHEMPLAEVMQTFQQNHELILKKLATLTEEDLFRPYNHYQPDSTEEWPIIQFVKWDTADHYREHIPWMRVIVENG